MSARILSDYDGLVIDLFAGGGGASLALEQALGRDVDIALNHDPIALAVHKANHPRTMHLEADIWSVDPAQVTRGRRVFVLWASPDCTHFSNAKGAQPRKKNIRSLAWSVVKWARGTRPRFIFLENVQEFRKWGPLDKNGRPCKKRAATTFNRWVKQLEALGYTVDYKVLDASQYGAPTKRRRLFVVARLEGAVHWPAITHEVLKPGKAPSLLLKPARTAAECIDWSIPCPSIFYRKKPLVEKTLCRIAHGIKRFVLEDPNPFIIKVNHGGDGFRGQPIDEPLSTITASRRGHGVVCPTLIQTGHGERKGQAPRVPGLHKPLGTIVTDQKHALIAAYMCKHFGDPRRQGGGGVVLGESLRNPAATITTRDHQSFAAVTLAKFRGTSDAHNHVAEVRAFLTAYYSTGTSHGQSLRTPLRTVRTRDCMGLVKVAGVDHQIVDIGLRMLQPHELLKAQFGDYADEYSLDLAETKEAKVRLIGNSVQPNVAIALITANISRQYQEQAA